MQAIRVGRLAVVCLVLASSRQLTVAQDGTCVTLMGLEGRCLSLSDCLKTLAARKGASSREGRWQERGGTPRQAATRCTFPNVCCEAAIEIGTRNEASVQPVPVGLLHPRVALLPLDSCGVSSQEMIVQGDRAASGQFPWMALLCYPNVGAREKCRCGGSLISSRFVLTAAHCVTKPKPFGAQPPSLVLLGVGDRGSCQGSSCGELRVRVERAVPHPDYEEARSRQNDVALLRLARPVDQRLENIRPICLPVGNIQFKNLENVRELIVAGWGSTVGRESSSRVLLFTGLREVARSECAAVYRGQQPIGSSQICASRDHHGACKGDSGGPLMMVDTVPWSATPRMVQVGVISFGPMPCGKPGEPAVFTRVAHFLDWILRTMEAA